MRRRARGGRRPPAEAGISLIEVLIAAAVVAVSLLAHAATTLNGHRLTTADEGRSVAIQATRQFLERMRSDADWAGLFARLRLLEAQARTAGGTNADAALLAPTVYYADYLPPLGITNVKVLVDVPDSVPLLGGLPVVGGTPVLREDASLAPFGLPFDLNGDGVIDSAARDADYRALPIIVTFRYEVPGSAPVRFQVHTWLTGER